MLWRFIFLIKMIIIFALLYIDAVGVKAILVKKHQLFPLILSTAV